MRLLPFLLAGPHILGVRGIAADSFAVIVAAPPALAIRLTTDALLWSITGRLKNLLAVSATPARTHARFLFSSGSKLRTSEQNKTGCRKNIETFVEFLPRPCRWGFQGWFTGSGLYRRNWLRLSPALTPLGRYRQSLNFHYHDPQQLPAARLASVPSATIHTRSPRFDHIARVIARQLFMLPFLWPKTFITQ